MAVFLSLEARSDTVRVPELDARDIEFFQAAFACMHWGCLRGAWASSMSIIGRLLFFSSGR